jgi:hypothetical protein
VGSNESVQDAESSAESETNDLPIDESNTVEPQPDESPAPTDTLRTIESASGGLTKPDEKI